MISQEDSNYCFEYSSYYKILPQLNNWHKDKKRIKTAKKYQRILFTIVTIIQIG
jgi:hypothetical protein